MWRKSHKKETLKKSRGVRVCTQKIYFRQRSLSLPYWRIREPRLTVVIDISSSSAISRCVFPATRACMILIRSSIASISWGLSISSRKPSRSSLWREISCIIFFLSVAWYDIIYTSVLLRWYKEDRESQKNYKKALRLYIES